MLDSSRSRVMLFIMSQYSCEQQVLTMSLQFMQRFDTRKTRKCCWMLLLFILRCIVTCKIYLQPQTCGYDLVKRCFDFLRTNQVPGYRIATQRTAISQHFRSELYMLYAFPFIENYSCKLKLHLCLPEFALEVSSCTRFWQRVFRTNLFVQSN